jgi:mRNA degradation ribonuclease J1/J2
VATYHGIELPESVLRERRALARAGAVHVGIVVDPRGCLAAAPAVWASGVLADEQEPHALRFVAVEVAKALEARPWGRGTPSDDAVADAARLAARRAVEGRTGRKPVAWATVIRLA